MCQKGDPFGNYHDVGDFLASCSLEFSPLFQLFNQLSKGFRRVVRPHHIDCVLLDIYLVDHPVAGKQILQHGECCHLFESHQLVHQWDQEDWFRHRDDLLLRIYVHSRVFSKQ